MRRMCGWLGSEGDGALVVVVGSESLLELGTTAHRVSDTRGRKRRGKVMGQ